VLLYYECLPFPIGLSVDLYVWTYCTKDIAWYAKISGMCMSGPYIIMGPLNPCARNINA